MSYANKIEQGIISQKDLIEILGISKLQVSRLLSYSKIQKNLFDAISDFRKVSSRTASELVRLSNQDEINIDILISFAEKIRNGQYGARKIEQELLKIKNNETNKKITITDKDNDYMFTITTNSNNCQSIDFSKKLIEKIKSKNRYLNDIANEIKEFFLERYY